MPERFKAFKKRATKQQHVQKVRYVIGRPLFSIPFATFFGLLVVGIAAFIVVSGGPGNFKLKSNDSNLVIISYDGKQQTVPTGARTVKDLLQRLNISLDTGDVVEPSLATPIESDNFRVNVYRATPVTIVDGDHKTFAYSAAATSRSIVKQAGITVYPEDNLQLLPTYNFLQDNSVAQRVVIDRATPINMNLYGTPITLRTHAKTVGDMLKEKDITLRDGDSVQPSKDTLLAADTSVFVIRKGKQVVSQEQPIDMPVEEVEDNSLSFGTTAVRQQGAAGKKIVTYEVELQNGQEIGRRVIQEVTTQEPVKQIVAKGTYVDIAKDRTTVMAAAGIARSDFTYADYVIEHESRWNPAAVNSSGCTGLGQACPGSKLAAACPNWRTDPVCQMRYFDGYAKGRYSGWYGAYQHKVAKGWW